MYFLQANNIDAYILNIRWKEETKTIGDDNKIGNPQSLILLFYVLENMGLIQPFSHFCIWL